MLIVYARLFFLFNIKIDLCQVLKRSCFRHSSCAFEHENIHRRHFANINDISARWFNYVVDNLIERGQQRIVEETYLFIRVFITRLLGRIKIRAAKGETRHWGSVAHASAISFAQRTINNGSIRRSHDRRWWIENFHSDVAPTAN